MTPKNDYLNLSKEERKIVRENYLKSPFGEQSKILYKKINIKAILLGLMSFGLMLIYFFSSKSLFDLIFGIVIGVVAIGFIVTEYIFKITEYNKFMQIKDKVNKIVKNKLTSKE